MDQHNKASSALGELYIAENIDSWNKHQYNSIMLLSTNSMIISVLILLVIASDTRNTVIAKKTSAKRTSAKRFTNSEADRHFESTFHEDHRHIHFKPRHTKDACQLNDEGCKKHTQKR